jgi:hypothetical protein
MSAASALIAFGSFCAAMGAFMRPRGINGSKYSRSISSKEPLIKCAFYDPTFPQGLKPIDSLSFMYGLKPVPFKSPT